MPKESQEPAKARKNAEPMAKPRKPATRTARVAKKPKVTHDMIARRAYELYERGTDGDMLEHWLEAERELQGA